MTNTFPAANDNFRVLLVEKDVPFARRIVEYFSNVALDCHHVAADNAVQTALVNVRPHLIVLDSAPDDFGQAILHELHDCCRAPIILLTSDENPGARNTGALQMVDDYVLKPFEFRHLALRVMARLQQINPPAKESRPQRAAEWLPYGWACCPACGYRGRAESFRDIDASGPTSQAATKNRCQCGPADEKPQVGATQHVLSCPRCAEKGAMQVAPM